jgi:signal transduction histidine kinase
LLHVLGLVKNPEPFRERVQWLYEHPDEIGVDEIELIEGKILDRYSSPVRDKAGKYYGRIWVFRDITERKKAEAARQSQLNELGRWHEAILDREDRILALKREVNELLARLQMPSRYHSPGKA